MIEIRKPVKRRTVAVYRVLYNQPRPIVVTLAPGDVLQFREAGRRAVFPLPIDRAFKFAVQLKAADDARRKREERKAKKAARTANGVSRLKSR